MPAIYIPYKGRSVHSPKLNRFPVQTPNGKLLEIHLCQSPHHIEVTPTDATKKFDALVIHELVQYVTRTTNWEKKAKVNKLTPFDIKVSLSYF